MNKGSQAFKEVGEALLKALYNLHQYYARTLTGIDATPIPAIRVPVDMPNERAIFHRRYPNQPGYWWVFHSVANIGPFMMIIGENYVAEHSRRVPPEGEYYARCWVPLPIIED